MVGCGGGHSVVRKQLGVEFPGVEPTVVGRMGDVKLAPGALVRNWIPTPFKATVKLGEFLEARFSQSF